MINEVKTKRAFYMGLKYIVLVLLAYQLLYPVLYMISASIKDPLDSYDPSVIWIPKNFSATGFIDAFKSMKYLDALKGSMEISLGCAVLDVMSCALAGYGFARFKFPLKNLLFACVILTLMVPMQTIILPYYMNMRYFDPLGLISAFNSVFDKTISINLVGKNIAFYLPSLFGAGIRSGLYIYIFRQFFEGMDKALEESAHIDGCGPLRTFLKIMLPNARNAIVTVFLFSFVWHFNDYYLTKQLLGTNRRTLIVALSSLRIDLAALIGGQTAFDPIRIQTRIQAGCLLAIVPMFLLYMFAQRKLADSIEHIGIK
ncbi:MAG: carbohydrate ABC transporter permease [Oscillospiraceae bacterium]|nr:carbohydrate ABC transporter permease [Oscillospiraceae bacterium]